MVAATPSRGAKSVLMTSKDREPVQVLILDLVRPARVAPKFSGRNQGMSNATELDLETNASKLTDEERLTMGAGVLPAATDGVGRRRDVCRGAGRGDGAGDAAGGVAGLPQRHHQGDALHLHWRLRRALDAAAALPHDGAAARRRRAPREERPAVRLRRHRLGQDAHDERRARRRRRHPALPRRHLQQRRRHAGTFHNHSAKQTWNRSVFISHSLSCRPRSTRSSRTE